MAVIDFDKISQLQVKYMEEVVHKSLNLGEKLKFGRSLIANYKKAKQILKSKAKIQGDWQTILEVSKEGIANLIENMETDTYHCDEIPAKVLIEYVDFLSAVQFLDFEDELHYKYVGKSLEEEVDLSLFGDY